MSRTRRSRPDRLVATMGAALIISLLGCSGDDRSVAASGEASEERSPAFDEIVDHLLENPRTSREEAECLTERYLDAYGQERALELAREGYTLGNMTDEEVDAEWDIVAECILGA